MKIPLSARPKTSCDVAPPQMSMPRWVQNAKLLPRGERALNPNILSERTGAAEGGRVARWAANAVAFEVRGAALAPSRRRRRRPRSRQRGAARRVLTGEHEAVPLRIDDGVSHELSPDRRGGGGASRRVRADAMEHEALLPRDREKDPICSQEGRHAMKRATRPKKRVSTRPAMSTVKSPTRACASSATRGFGLSSTMKSPMRLIQSGGIPGPRESRRMRPRVLCCVSSTPTHAKSSVQVISSGVAGFTNVEGNTHETPSTTRTIRSCAPLNRAA